MAGRGTACNDDTTLPRAHVVARSRAMPNRNAGSRGSLLRALRASVVLGLPLSAAVGACAGPKKVYVDPNTDIGFGDAGVSQVTTPGAEARCGKDAIQCGTPARGSSDLPG